MGRLALRHSLKQWAHAPANVAPPTPLEIFGSMTYEWDYALGVTVATGISSHADQIAAFAVAQGTGSLQPAYTANGALSYGTGDGTGDYLVSGAGTDITGGDLVYLAVLRKLATPASSGIMFGMGSATLSRSQLRIQSTGAGALDGVIRDSVGSDVISSTVTDTNWHTVVLYNDVGVRRCLWVDGGAGVNGARTTATNTAHTHASMFGGPTGASLANASIAYIGVLTTAPSLAQINQFGSSWAQWRFGALGLTAWSTAT